MEFEYWSTGGYTQEALNKLKTAEISTKKYKISIYGLVELREKVLKMKNKKLKEALDNFFFKLLV
jgi:hypothetical protein